MTLNYNVDINELNAKATRKSNLRNMMDEFINANAPAAEIDWRGNYSSATNAYSCLNNFLHRNPKYSIKIIRKGEHVYLMSKSATSATNE